MAQYQLRDLMSFEGFDPEKNGAHEAFLSELRKFVLERE